MKDTIEFEHCNISFNERIKHYSFILIGIISITGLLCIINTPENFLPFITIISILFGTVIGYKIYKARYYIVKLFLDAEKIEVTYLDKSKEVYIESLLEKVDFEIIETSSRFYFNCKLMIYLNGLSFEINNDFDWHLDEIKQIFLFLKNHTNENLTEKEKFLIERLEEELIKTPF
jgi:hypothetical protein